MSRLRTVENEDLIAECRCPILLKARYGGVRVICDSVIGGMQEVMHVLNLRIWRQCRDDQFAVNVVHDKEFEQRSHPTFQKPLTSVPIIKEALQDTES
ncbi:hypothetical protein Tco_0799076 [Tanacetum coccineum]